jgi:hypothetical protein
VFLKFWQQYGPWAKIRSTFHVFLVVFKSLQQHSVQYKVGRTPACVKTCNYQDTISATWCKEMSTVETNEIMKTAAHRSESWCWRQPHAADTCSKTRHVPFPCVKT